jgi:hypothetical protein
MSVAFVNALEPRDGQGHDFRSPSLTFPLDDSGFAFGASNEENVDRHGERKFAHHDLHVPVDNFVSGDFTHPQRKLTHTRLQCSTIRQEAIGTHRFKLSQPINVYGYFVPHTAVTASAGQTPLPLVTRRSRCPQWPAAGRPSQYAHWRGV